MNKIKLLKSLDNSIGKLLVYIVPVLRMRKNEQGNEVSNILIIRPGGIGDAVLLIPAIKALKMKYPEAAIDVLCEKRNDDIFKLSKSVNSIYLYDRNLDLMRCLKNKYDVVIDTEQWHRLSAVVAYLTAAPVRIGFGTNERRDLLTHKIQYSHDEYEAYSFYHLLEPLISKGTEFDVNKPFVKVDDNDLTHIAKGMTGPDGKIIAIFPGASVKERKWGGNKYGEVAKRLARRGYKIVILGSKMDSAEADEIKGQAADCVDLTGKTTLREAAALLKRSQLLITADSGLMHIAYAVGTPTVSLFGSGIEKKWAPPGAKHIVLNKHLDCSPCTKFGYTPACRRDIECLSLISIDEVIDAAISIVN